MDSTDRGPKGLFRTQRKHPVRLRCYESGKRALLRCVTSALGAAQDSFEMALVAFSDCAIMAKLWDVSIAPRSRMASSFLYTPDPSG